MASSKIGKCNTSNQDVIQWVDQIVALCQPTNIFWCDGSEPEKFLLTEEAVSQKILIELNQEKLPGCYYHRSNPNDVARVEQCTYICTDTTRRGRADQQLGSARRKCIDKLHTLLHRRDERAHDVCRSLSDGAARFSH